MFKTLCSRTLFHATQLAGVEPSLLTLTNEENHYGEESCKEEDREEGCTEEEGCEEEGCEEEGHQEKGRQEKDSQEKDIQEVATSSSQDGPGFGLPAGAAA
ncbi:MAG TPA: hypothetical protein VML01_02525 [Bryobacterales bacterium]|nr:hypothetical protein [Bryobacterales bacterium]